MHNLAPSIYREGIPYLSGQACTRLQLGRYTLISVVYEPFNYYYSFYSWTNTSLSTNLLPMTLTVFILKTPCSNQ